MSFKLLVIAFIQAVLNTVGAGLIKGALTTHKLDTPLSYITLFFQNRAILGVLAIGLGFLCVLKVLEGSRLSVFIPITSALSFIVVGYIDIAYFNNKITTNTIIGMLLTLAGIFFLLRDTPAA